MAGGPPISYDSGYVPNCFARVHARTDAEGRFTLEDLFLGEEPDDDHFATCSVAVRTGPASRAIRIGQERDFDGNPFEIVARGTQAFVVKVVPEDGATPSGPSSVLAIWSAADEEMPGMAFVLLRGTTDAKGECRFSGLPRGRVQSLEVIAPGIGVARWPSAEEEQPTEGPDRMEVRVPRGLVFTGAVHSASGEPIGGAEVRAVLFRLAVAASTRTDASGRFRLVGAPGDRSEPNPRDLESIRVVAPGLEREWPYSKPVPTEKPGEYTLDVTLVPPGSLLGRVVDEKGRGVGGAEVRVGPHRVLAGDDGTFLVLDMERDEAQEVSAGHPDDIRPDWNVSSPAARAKGPHFAESPRLGSATARIVPGQRATGVEIVLRRSE